ncbi:MAG: hypothetical protein HY958_08425 [Bacteroidia bacterium]|nr:hypothetical protein [Bacteroidia bacterium]
MKCKTTKKKIKKKIAEYYFEAPARSLQTSDQYHQVKNDMMDMRLSRMDKISITPIHRGGNNEDIRSTHQGLNFRFINLPPVIQSYSSLTGFI